MTKSILPLQRRETCDLVIAEHALIWPLRMLHEQPQGEMAVAAFLRRVFGLAAVEEALASLGTLDESLSVCPTRRPTIDKAQVACHEETLAGLIWALQAGERDAADGLALAVFAEGQRKHGLIASGLYAHLLAEQGLAIPRPRRFEPLSGPERSLPVEMPLARLWSGERLTIRAARLWAAVMRAGRCALTETAAMMNRHAVPAAAAASLNHVMLLTLGSATRAMALKPPPCPQTTDDERGLVAAAAAEPGDPERRQRLSWLPDREQAWAEPALEGLCNALRTAGLALPKRDMQLASDPPLWMGLADG
jgi:hypothetical protein